MAIVITAPQLEEKAAKEKKEKELEEIKANMAKIDPQGFEPENVARIVEIGG